MENYVTHSIVFTQMFDEEPLDIREYMTGIDKEWLLRIICYMIGICSIDSYSYRCRNFIKVFFQDYSDSSIVKQLYDRLVFVEKDFPSFVCLTFGHPMATLNFLRECILLPSAVKSQKSLDDLLNIFKAYLVFVERRNKRLQKILETIPNNEIKNAKIVIVEGLQDYGLVEFNLQDIKTMQRIKCLAFNQFMQSHDVLKNVQKTFFEINNFKSSYDYFFKVMLPLEIYKPSKFNEGFIALERNDWKNKLSDVWKSLLCYWNNISIDVNDLERAKNKLMDYKDNTCFKQYPLLKINDDIFFVVSTYFYALKPYDSLKRDIKQLCENKFKNTEITKGFNSFVTTEFSEHILLYRTLEQFLGSKKYFALTGEFFNSKGLSRRPDYYIRIHNHIFLFEFKDMLINKNVKDSENIEQFVDYIKERLDCEKVEKSNGKQKTKNKGIPQLINNIDDILSGRFESDKKINSDTIRIYSILIIDNRLISLNGINYIMDKWFQKRINQNINLNKYRNQIMPLLVFDYDFLILLSLSLKNQFGKFVSLYHSYQNYLKNSYDFYKYTSFRNYVLNNNKLQPATKSQAKEVTNHIIG